MVSEIPSDDTTPAQPVGVEPTSDCRIGGELDRGTAPQELDTNIDGRAIEKSHSPSLQPCDGNDPTIKVEPVRFLQDFRGEEPWTLVAIRKDPRDFQACTFIAAADRDKSAAHWVMKFNGSGYEIYFAVNPLKRPMTKKAGKADVASAQWLWVDLDPLDGAELNLERQEMLALLTDRRPQGLPEPTCIVDSGRGYWAFWKLRTPQPVDGYGPRTENVENYGRGIEKEFPGRGDDCRNIDRVARLPGTINHKTGLRARVVEHRPENAYELTDFPRVEAPLPSGGKAANSHLKNKGNGEPSRFRPGGIDVDNLPVPETIEEMIRTGRHPRNPERYESRSEGVLAVLVAMAGEGCDDATMTALMLDPELPIGAHIRKQPDPERYLERQIRKARHHVANLPRRLPSGLPDKQIRLAMQRKELRLLHRLRQLNLPFETWASEKGIDLGHLYDPAELGVLVQFTVEEDNRFATDPMGRARNGLPWKGFPKRLMPVGFTRTQTKERRKKFNRPKRTAAQRTRRAEKRAAKLARIKQAADLRCRKRAILTVLSDEWMTISDLTKSLANSQAFMTPDGKTFLKGDSLRRAVARELEKPDLKCQIEVSKGVHKHGLTMKRIRRRPPGYG